LNEGKYLPSIYEKDKYVMYYSGFIGLNQSPVPGQSKIYHLLANFHFL